LTLGALLASLLRTSAVLIAASLVVSGISC
jgi:hypothetical protein